MRPNNLTLVKVTMSYNKPRLGYVQKVIAIFIVMMIAYLCTVIADNIPSWGTLSFSPMFSSTLNNEIVALEETTTDSTYETPSLIETPISIEEIEGNINENMNLYIDTSKESMLGFFNLSEDIINERIEEAEKINNPLNYYEFNTGWTSGRVNVRDGAGLDSNIYETKNFNREIEYSSYNENWAIIKYDEGENGVAYIHKKYISDYEPNCISMSAPSPNRKSYMYYQAITNTASKQYALQMRASTNDKGLRMLNGRFLIALGSSYSVTIGQYVDLVLENGTVIECILGDAKSDRHTDATHRIALDGSVAEFIVDTNLNSKSRYMGDASYSYDGWNSPVTKVIIYDKVV